MPIDFEGEGLLEGTSGEARQARLELLRHLAADGFELEELRTAVAEDRLALLPVERVLEGEPGERLTGVEIAERSGLEPEMLLRQRRALGLPAVDPDEPAFGPDDLEAARRVKAFQDSGMPEEALLEMARVLGMAMSQVAAANRSLIRDHLLSAGDTERDAGLKLAAAARELGPLVGESLQFVLNLHLREQVRGDVIGAAQLTAGSVGTGQVTAGFVDMVGFTALGEQLPPEDLGRVTGRLGEIAADVATAPVRLVKMIGDAAMLAAPECEPVVEAALTMIEAAAAEGEDFPLLRGGIAQGPAVSRSGDWYGRPVNLASRITGIARPGTALASQEAKEAAEGFSYSFAGERRIRGIKGRVRLFRVRRE
jgi:adenylate cyclase